MSIFLALLSALGLGAGDFFAGLASRRLDVRVVSAFSQSAGLVAALLAVPFLHGDGLTGHVLLWGALAGVGNGVGAILLYHGLAVGRMSVVATLSGVTGAVIPVLVGLIRGDPLSSLSAVGIVLAIPAIALVSWRPATGEDSGGNGAIWGVLAGLAFALLYVAFDRAGDASGVWPAAVSQLVAVAIAGSLALPIVLSGRPVVPASARTPLVCAGVGLGLGVVALQVAFTTGELTTVVVLTSLYPGVTTLLARFGLGEHWAGTQKVGLAAALIAVVVVSLGSG